MSKLRNLKFWWGAILTGTLITLSLNVVRLSGVLQPAEWSALDWLFQSRSTEPTDRRIVIVGIDETDLQKLNKYPIDDLTLAKLIGKIKTQNPQVIGLDLHRDLPVPPGHSQLVKVFQSTSNLIGIEKVIGTKIAPPPVLAQLGHTAASDVIIDGDGVLRRGLLFPQTPEKPSLPTLGLAVALKYLEKEKIQPVSGEGGWLKLDKVTFFPFEKNDGGYRNTDAGSYQILLNFRGGASTFLQVSLHDVLENRVKSDIFANRLVLIGSSAVSLKDSFYTPYSKGLTTTPQRTYGVEIHAQVASQIISAVLDSRPLLKVWSEPVEYIWISLWIVLPSIVYWQCRSAPEIVKLLLTILLSSSGGTVILIGSVKWAFIQGWWLPVIPNLLGLWGATFLSILCIYLARLIEHKENLETQVKLRTQELAQALQALRATQQKILAQDKLAYLGFLTTGIAHEIKNPLNLIFNYLDLAQELNQELFNLSQVKTSFFLAEGLQKNLQNTRKQANRIAELVQSIVAQLTSVNEEKKIVNLQELISCAWELVFDNEEKSEIVSCLQLETIFDESLPEIEVIDTKIIQVFVNLFDNACNALSKKRADGVTDFMPKITISCRNLEKKVEITIVDNGTGIDLTVNGNICEPFMTTKTPGTGTGLGLAIVKEIINLHQGEINWQSEIGLYTKVIIILPKALD